MITGDAFDLRHGLAEGRFTLATINSLTKYPSIDTYHTLERGVLREYATDDFASGASATLPPVGRFVGEVEITEKIDGTNARLIIFPDGSVIVGSREELLWARGDLIANPALGIVDALRGRGAVAAASALLTSHNWVRVVYGEVYGAGIGAAGKRYAADGKLTGFRVFDVASVPLEALAWPVEHAATWRQRGGQRFESDGRVIWATARSLGVERVPATQFVEVGDLPRTVADAETWLRERVPHSRAALLIRDGRLIEAEGIVLRGRDAAGERLLAKLRFEDYARTRKRLEQTR